MSHVKKKIDRRAFLKSSAAAGALSIASLTPVRVGAFEPTDAQATPDVYTKLRKHISCLAMGYPQTEGLDEYLKALLTPEEAEVCLALPNILVPLQAASMKKILSNTNLPKEKVEKVLKSLGDRNLLFTAKMENGEQGYAFHQEGFGFPQVFGWAGKDTPYARKMFKHIFKYMSPEQIKKSQGNPTKAFRYVPMGQSVDVSLQEILPYDAMEHHVKKAEAIAVCHCACRTGNRLVTGFVDPHPTEVCIKFNKMAQYVIDRGVGRELTKKEALALIKKTEEAGLVHFVDNSQEVQHNCNCCGCSCWNVGNIRRRAVPRDAIMETYFIRYTDTNKCTGCGECAEICPVQAATIEDDVAVVDKDWCIGCGVCTRNCEPKAIKMRTRADKIGEKPPKTMEVLQTKRLGEKAIQVLKKNGWNI